ncbi:MAG: HEPN domain-containing protein [Chlamydiae bacterium]|nr:HEPN domain-containing protein [Chlamydiota bacterium]MBI3266521.1 HEPN domain-containing protein [Chlamydiota bacterium]
MVSGQVGEWSDLDLAIVKKTKKKFVDRLVEVARLAHSYEAVDLDQYYRPTRYPDAVVGTLPTGLPGEKHAKEALKIAKQVYDKTCETRDHK